MRIAVLHVEMHLPYSQSPKDKRMVLRRVKDRLQNEIDRIEPGLVTRTEIEFLR